MNLIKKLKQGPTIISYHGVEENIFDNRIQNLHVSVDNFRKQLDYLRNNYEVISADQLYNQLCSEDGIINSNQVLITFDDGYQNVLETAAPILNEYKYPFTVFVNTAYVDSDERAPTFYLRLAINCLKIKKLRLNCLKRQFALDDDLSRKETMKILSKTVKSEEQELVEEIIEEIKNMFPKTLLTELKAKYKSEKLLNWKGLRDLVLFGATIGSHCHRHTVLNAKQKDSTIESELLMSKELIEKNIGECKYFAYPNGSKSYISPKAAALVGDLYLMSFTTEVGEISKLCDMTVLPRVWAGPNLNQTIFSLTTTFRKNKKYYNWINEMRTRKNNLNV